MLVGKECEGCELFMHRALGIRDACYHRWVDTGGKCQDEITQSPTINPSGNCVDCVGEFDNFICGNRKAVLVEWGCYLRKTKPKEEDINMDRKTKYDPESSYYCAGGIETLDIIKAKLTEEQYEGYLLGNVIKYSCRLNFKNNVARDLTKLANYSKWLKEFVEMMGETKIEEDK